VTPVSRRNAAVNALGVSYPTRFATRPAASPAASSGSAAEILSSVRQRPNGSPVPVTKALANVRSPAPTTRPQSARVRWSAGSARRARATGPAHHVPTTALQNAILAGALGALRPGGILIGSDSLPSDRLHQFHEGDTYNPVEPTAFLTRLQTIGFGEVTITVGHNLLFRARKENAS
jgi:hypothetical protein